MANERFAVAALASDGYRDGSVMIWGGIWKNGRTIVTVIINGNLNSEGCVLGKNHYRRHSYCLYKHDDFVLYLDNARPHAADIVTETLEHGTPVGCDRTYTLPQTSTKASNRFEKCCSGTNGRVERNTSSNCYPWPAERCLEPVPTVHAATHLTSHLFCK